VNPAEKAQATAVAEALLAGISAVPSRDEHGRHTVILTRGPWTREVLPENLAAALAEAKALPTTECAA
jgi:hypothetical protein